MPTALLAFVLLSGVLAGGACSPAAVPSLDIVAPGAAGPVPLDTPIELRVAHAQLKDVLLERLDDPTAGAPSVTLSDAGAVLGGPLAPDARYRLVARAAELPATLRPPWDQTPPAVVEQERTFATVRTPRLESLPAATLTRGAPLTVRFTEPLAEVQARAPLPATAEIVPSDPRTVRVTLRDLPPGEELAVQLTGIVGLSGRVAAPDVTLDVRMPEAPALAAISGAPAAESVVVPANTDVTLDWSLPVRKMRFRLGEGEQTWSGAPTRQVPLPGTLAQGESRLLTVLDAETDEGGWLAAPQSLTLEAPAALQLAAFWPADGARGVTPNADPTFRFTEPISDRAAAEAAISFSPSVPGRFEWLANNRVRFLPDEPFPREAPIRVEVKAGPSAARGQSGSYLIEPVSFSFQTGKLKVIQVSLREQRLVLLEDGAPVWSAAVSTGVRGAETPPGTYEVQYKMPVARFRGVNPGGSRYDIPDVKWVLAFLGDYTIHGAYWRTAFGRPASNGCISLTDANAKHVYDWADVGTAVVIRP
jgi:lipoprotein-anchoring transpeptidase ErfK/SrfK